MKILKSICTIHGIEYVAGSNCPSCDRELQAGIERKLPPEEIISYDVMEDEEEFLAPEPKTNISPIESRPVITKRKIMPPPSPPMTILEEAPPSSVTRSSSEIASQNSRIEAIRKSLQQHQINPIPDPMSPNPITNPHLLISNNIPSEEKSSVPAYVNLLKDTKSTESKPEIKSEDSSLNNQELTQIRMELDQIKFNIKKITVIFLVAMILFIVAIILASSEMPLVTDQIVTPTP